MGEDMDIHGPVLIVEEPVESPSQDGSRESSILDRCWRLQHLLESSPDGQVMPFGTVADLILWEAREGDYHRNVAFLCFGHVEVWLYDVYLSGDFLNSG